MSDAPMNDLAKAAAAAFAKPFGGLIRLEPEGAPALWVDGRAFPPEIGAGPPGGADEAPVCVWRASRDTLMRIFEGERLLASAYVSGRLSIAGDMSIMARLHLERGPRG
jgi:hypothetical protein